jgi:hypothetical protein
LYQDKDYLCCHAIVISGFLSHGKPSGKQQYLCVTFVACEVYFSWVNTSPTQRGCTMIRLCKYSEWYLFSWIAALVLISLSLGIEKYCTVHNRL